jgi:hypothetical protein
MLSVTNKYFRLSVIIFNVIRLNEVKMNIIMLNVVKLRFFYDECRGTIKAPRTLK